MIKSVKEMFWADQIATKVIGRAKKENRKVTCRSAASPSGGKHIGNLFDVVKSYIVYKAVNRKNFPCRAIFTHDDRDPLRTVPPRLPGLDGTWKRTDKKLEEAISVYLGRPYFLIPDPFDCCDSWAEHFSKVWEDGIYALGMDKLKTYSTNELYNQGKFEPYVILALKNIEKSRQIVQKYQTTKLPDYIPFDVICENCKKIIGQVTDFDLENKTVKYVCEGKSLAGKYTIEGCGFSGEVDFKSGKLPWSFEWPAQWALWGTTFEPFGKELAEGSWPLGKEICENIYGSPAPISHIYEFLLVDGEKMAARRGNAYITQEILEIIEPEIFLYFYTKRSKKQRNLDFKNINLLIEDFEHAEKAYFGLEEEKNAHEMVNLIRMYESCWKNIPTKPPLRIPYTFAAVVAEVCPHSTLKRALELLRAAGHIREEISKKDENNIKTRLILAKNWLEKFAPEKRIVVNDKLPEKIKEKLNEKQKQALKMLVLKLKKKNTQDDLYKSFFDISKEVGLGNKDFFKAVYQVLISKSSGPRLAPFILALGEIRVKKILDQVK